MSTSRPEADTEYSRGDAAAPARAPRPDGRSAGLTRALTGGGLLAALLLLAAEFTPLLHVHSNARGNPVVKTVSTGSHHAYALVPIALLAAALVIGARRAPQARLAWAAVGALGLVALGIALLGDLPAAHSSGLIGHAGGPYTARPPRRRSGSTWRLSERSCWCSPAGPDCCSRRRLRMARRPEFRAISGRADGPLPDLPGAPTVYQHQARYI